MTQLLENHLPVVRSDGLATNKAVAFGSTFSVAGAVSLAAAMTINTAASATWFTTQIAGTTRLTISGSGGNDTINAASDNIIITSGAAMSIRGTTSLTLQHSIAIPAGGSTAGAVLMSSTAAFGIYFGSGDPTVSAAQGSIYLRTDGSSTSTRMYVNTNGSTGWTAVTTAT